MTSTQTASQQHLPFWSKFLIILVVLALTAVFAGGIASIFGVKRLAKDAHDPVLMARTAHDIGAFPEPLPDGYQYKVAVSLPIPGVDMVTIEHQPEKQLLTFIYMQTGVVPQQDDEKAMLDEGYSRGLFMLETSARFVGLKQEATVKVGGHEMPYIIGATVNSITDEKGQGMVGCMQIPVKDGRKNILIYALQTTDVPYNQQITLNLLNSIKSF